MLSLMINLFWKELRKIKIFINIRITFMMSNSSKLRIISTFFSSSPTKKRKVNDQIPNPSSAPSASCCALTLSTHPHPPDPIDKHLSIKKSIHNYFYSNRAMYKCSDELKFLLNLNLYLFFNLIWVGMYVYIDL